MKLLFVFATFFTCFSVLAGVNNRDYKIKEFRAYQQFIISIERQYQLAEAQDTKKPDLEILNLLNIIFEKAWATETNLCFFGGWPSEINAGGYCSAPWKTAEYATSAGFSAYGPSCGGNYFRCNPEVFGPGPSRDEVSGLSLGDQINTSPSNGTPANGFCVAIPPEYKGLSEKCQEVTSKLNTLKASQNKSPWPSSLGSELDTFLETKFLKYKDSINEFCQKSFYKDNTCTALKKELAMIQEATPPSDNAQAKNCGSIANEGNETRTMYQTLEVTSPATCTSEQQMRTCHEGVWTEWNGTYTFSSCSIKTASEVVSRTDDTGQPETTRVEVIGSKGSNPSEIQLDNQPINPSHKADRSEIVILAHDPIVSSPPNPSVEGVSNTPVIQAPAPAPIKNCEDIKHGENKTTTCYKQKIISGVKKCEKFNVIQSCNDGQLIGSACEMLSCEESPVRQYGASFIGGAAGDDFYTDGGTGFLDATKAKKSGKSYFDNSQIYYGGKNRIVEGDPNSGRQCRTLTADNPLPVEADPRKRKIQQVRKDFMSASECPTQELDLIAHYFFGEYAESNPVCNENLEVSGEATQENYNEYFNNLIEGNALGAGDRVYIQIQDHGGDKSIGQDQHIIALSDGNTISVNDLKQKIKKLTAKGINVQLNFDACFSGGFSNMVNELNNEIFSSAEGDLQSLPKTCSSSMTTDTTFGYGRDALILNDYPKYYNRGMKAYKNQLSAFACGVGGDSINRPISTLDHVVEEWAQKNKIKGIDHFEDYSCKSMEKFISTTIGQAESNLNDIAAIATKLKREALLKDFDQLFVKPYKDCYIDGKSDADFFKKIGQCVKNLNPADVPKIGDMLFSDMNFQEIFCSTTGPAEDGLSTPFSNIKIGNDFDADKIKKSIAMISDPRTTEEDLNKFMSQFCCLGYNFESKSEPSSCELFNY